MLRVPDRVAIARVLTAHGIAGALRIEPLGDNRERFRSLSYVYIGKDSQEKTAVEWVQLAAKYLIIKLAAVNSRDAALELRNEVLFVEGKDVPPLPEGCYYVFQLVGLPVWTTDGAHLGEISDVLQTGANDVYIVESAEGQILVPATKEVVKSIDLAHERIVIEPLEGLLP